MRRCCSADAATYDRNLFRRLISRCSCKEEEEQSAAQSSLPSSLSSGEESGGCVGASSSLSTNELLYGGNAGSESRRWSRRS